MQTKNNGVLNDIYEHPKCTNLFSFFKAPIKNIKPDREITIRDIHSIITDPTLQANTEIYRNISNEKKAKQHKNNRFDYVTFNGTFSQRNDALIIKPSCYVIGDIDKQKNIKIIKDRLIEDENLCPVLVFISPSGKGLKMVYRIDPALIDLDVDSNKMHRPWTAINSYLAKKYSDIIIPDEKGNFIDELGKDLSRACYVCYDPECYIDENSDKIIDQVFIDQYPPMKKASKVKKIVSPKTTLQTLQKRHCLSKDNHHKQIFAFVNAAKAIGEKCETVQRYIHDNIHIDPESKHQDSETLTYLLEDIYCRYPSASEGAVKLTELSFAYDIFSFKYSRDAEGFILSGLYYEGIRQMLKKQGYFKRYISKEHATLIKENGPIISEVSTENLRDVVTRYVDSLINGLAFIYQGLPYNIPSEAIREIYLKQSNNIFNKIWLEHVEVHIKPLLRDSEHTVFFPFRNKIVEISKSGIFEKPVNEFAEICVWDTQLINRDFNYISENLDCHFSKFLENITNNDSKRLEAFITTIGYLLHFYFRPSEGEAVILYDEAITDTKRPMGGTGKGLIANAIKQLRSVAKVDGKHLDESNRFKWEMIQPSTQVVWLDDVKPDFNFSVLHTNLTDGWTVERKYLSQFFIQPADSPKTLICSNSILTSEGTTNTRRQWPLELGDYYSKRIERGGKGPIEKEHGGLFFTDDWDKSEWNKFFSFMCDCVVSYFVEGRKPHPEINTAKNRLRQQTNEDFVTWVESKDFKTEADYKTKDHYGEFTSMYYGDTTSLTQRKFTNWLQMFADSKKWTRNVRSVNNSQYFRFSG